MWLIFHKAFDRPTIAHQSAVVLAGLLCLLLIQIKPVYSQNLRPNKIQFEHISTEQGLSHNFVMYVMQDRKGYLWFGTGNGLDKYDGYRFTNYKFDPYDSTSIPKNQVFMIWEDSLGMIWVGTSEGTSIFDPKSEKFTRLERSASNPHAFKFGQSINEDREGNLWVGGSFEGELRQIERKTGKFSALNYTTLLDSGFHRGLQDSHNLHISFKDKGGILWFGSPSGLHRLDHIPQGSDKPSRISFTHYRHDPADPHSLSHNSVTGYL